MKTKLGLLVFAVSFFVSFQCFAQVNILRLNAPEEILELLKQWNGKYVMYVHKEANVKEFKDIDGMVLMVAWIEGKDIPSDATSFIRKSGLKMTFALQNNPRMYDKQFLEEPNYIGIMVKSVAEHYKFDANKKLQRIELE